jgi:hypothetical protein
MLCDALIISLFFKKQAVGVFMRLGFCLGRGANLGGTCFFVSTLGARERVVKLNELAQRKLCPLVVVLTLLGVCANFAVATPYWSHQDYERHQVRIGQEAAVTGPHGNIPSFFMPSRTLTELDEYALLFEYVQICDFLTVMQEMNPASPDFGGMHEGETPDLWAIVETDNTQEAIRVWSGYGDLSGDLETFRQNVEAAWAYTLENPAYDEEGTESDYYRVHNCGWALVAEAEYRQVYGDSSYLWYADSCAQYIMAHRLGYTGYPYFYNSLHPLVEGWASGSLYDYGVEWSSSSAVSHALLVGSDVQTWIEANPNRLNSNEVWALCGGTALWGVCRSVFADNPAMGQTWLPQYLPYMDTYASYGEWNNSWNVWYAHAYHASAAILEDSLYTGLAFALVDTLLDSDTDNDGGIVATSSNPATMDQSWVSCYLDWMGLEPLILQSPTLDVAAFGFLLPDSTLPVAQGEFYDVRVIVANSGIQEFGNVNVSISGAFTALASTYLDFGDVDTVSVGTWTPSQIGEAQLTMVLSPGGQNATNDTAFVQYSVLGRGIIVGAITDQATAQGLTADLAFYHDAFPPDEPLYMAATDPQTGFYAISVMEGIYRIVVDPAIPYTDREQDDLVVAAGDTATVDFELMPAPILLVDDDGGANYENYFAPDLSAGGYDAYDWDADILGSPQAELNLFPALVWFTANEIDSALTPTEQAHLTQFMDAGGSLLLTGQNIAQSLAGQPFLEQYLGCNFVSPVTTQPRAIGVPGDPVSEGDTLLLVGAPGAGNQTSKDVISPAANGIEAMVYFGGSGGTAAVRVEDSHKMLFLSFGLEAGSGLGGTTTREQFLIAVMDWFEIETAIPPDPPPEMADLPLQFSLAGLYPNPFNAGARLQIELARPSEASISIYNIIGQKVADLGLGVLPEGIHSIGVPLPSNLGSGVYIFMLHTPEGTGVQCGTLLK